MADKDIDKPSGAPEPVKSATAQAKSELPTVESPPLSPAEPAPMPSAETIMIDPIEETHPPAAAAAAPAIEAAATAAEIAATPAARPRFSFNARAQRNALLAASVAIAAALGAVLGAVASGGFAKPAQTAVAALEERKAMQQSIQRLAKEITTLKGNLEAANKSVHTQLAKISERLKRESAEITGSISAPQTVAAAPAAAPMTTPLPPPRPAPRNAAVESQPPIRPAVVQGWTIRDIRDGYVYVQGQGDVFQVVPGAPLPGLGPVEAIKRQDGRWVVVTPKGLIVAMRDRRYFESF